jgi:hypothetical protein
MNKSDFITLINTKLPDGTNLPSVDHRNTMHTNANSIIELVYGDAVSDNQTTQTYTSSSALFDYTIKIWKIGSNVHITGDFKANSSLVGNTVVFNIVNTDFLSLGSDRFVFIATNSTTTIPIAFRSSQLVISRSIFSGERFDFTIQYKSQN